MRIPTVSVVFGPSTAGGAYLPGMSDYVVMVRNRASVYLAGPPLVKMATGEVSDEESLGGAEMHSRVSGLSDYLAESELDGIRIAREIVSHFHLTKPLVELAPVEEPKYSSDELLGIVSADPRVPFLHHAGDRIRARPRFFRGHSGEQRSVNVGIGGQGRAVHRAGESAEYSVVISAEYHRIYGWAII